MKRALLNTLGLGIALAAAGSARPIGAQDEPFFSIAPTADSIAPTAERIELGSPFSVQLRPEDAGFDIERIVHVEFAEHGEVWHVARPWSRNQKDDAAPSGPWRASVMGFEVGETALPDVRVTYRAVDGSITEATVEGTSIFLASTLAEEGPAPRADSGDDPDGAAASTASKGSSAVPSVTYEDGKTWAYDPDRDPVDFPLPWGLIIVAVAAAVLAMGLLIFTLFRVLGRRSRVPAPVPAPPPLPPGVWAMREIQRRRALPECRSGSDKFLATQVSEVIRVYLGRRYDFNALDMTSYECMGAFESLVAETDLRRVLRNFFADCDLAKFSKFELDTERRDGLWIDAEKLVQATSPSSELPSGSAPKPPEAQLAGVAGS